MDIFVYRPGAIGDTILTLPALAAMRHRFPGCRITFAGNSACLPLLPVEEALSADDPRLLGLFLDPPAAWRPFDYYVVFAGSPAELRPGIQRSPLSGAAQGRHVSDWLVDAIDPEFAERVPRLAMAGPGSPAALGLVLHPGAGSPVKRWPLDSFVQLSAALGLPVAITAGPADGNLGAEAAGRIPGSLLWQDLPLPELAKRLSQARLFVGNDSGITHLAAALGVPTLGLYLATDPAVWGVRGARAQALSGQDLTPERVIDVCRRQLGQA